MVPLFPKLGVDDRIILGMGGGLLIPSNPKPIRRRLFEKGTYRIKNESRSRARPVQTQALKAIYFPWILRVSNTVGNVALFDRTYRTSIPDSSCRPIKMVRVDDLMRKKPLDVRNVFPQASIYSTQPFKHLVKVSLLAPDMI